MSQVCVLLFVGLPSDNVSSVTIRSVVCLNSLKNYILYYDRDQEAILNDVRVDLALQFEFLFSATHVEVISGKQEGIYSWIAVNHALGKFDHFLHSGCSVIVCYFIIMWLSAFVSIGKLVL